MNFECFIFLLIFKLFLIGYGPTPNKRKDIMLKTKNSQGFSLYNIERENPFEGRFFSLQGCKESRSPFLSVWEVWKRFLQIVLQAFWKNQVSRWKCVQECSSIHWKFEVCGRKVIELLKVWSFKCVKESFSHCCKFKVKFQACVRKYLQMIDVFLFEFMWGAKDFFQSFQTFERVFVVAFVFKMFSFQMESVKVMERFDGGNFHIWKFKMRMMFSKHGLCKFVDGSATLLSEEVASQRSFVFIVRNLDILWEIVWRKKMMKKKKLITLVKITSKCLLWHWVPMIIPRMIGLSILVQCNTWHSNKNGLPCMSAFPQGSWAMTPFWRPLARGASKPQCKWEAN